MQTPQIPLVPFQLIMEGEVRLTGIQMPDYIRNDLDYDVILNIDSDEMPQISKVCFRWLAEEISSTAPSLSCFVADGDFGTGSHCNYTGNSMATLGSNTFCVQGSDVGTGIPGRLVARIRPTGLRGSYNRLQGQVEYIYGGQLKLTNSVKTSVIVDELGRN
jgi:hypothetical protein